MAAEVWNLQPAPPECNGTIGKVAVKSQPSLSSLMAGRLIAHAKNPGVRPIAIFVLRRLIAKCALSAAKGEAQEACGIDQLWGMMEKTNEIDVYTVRDLYCIFDIVEHHPIPPLNAMAVELDSP